MLSNLLNIDGSLKTFFSQLTEALGFGGYLGIVLGVEALLILLFVVKSFFSYEARLKKSLDKANQWLFKYKKIDPSNIKAFNEVIKSGPKRFAYYWQQFILYRDGGPTAYLTEENVIEKPLRTSSWQGNVKNLGILTAVWALISFTFGIASQITLAWSFQTVATALVFPILVLILGAAAMIFIRVKMVLNLDDIYHLFHLFSRFISNACADLPPYIDFDLLFTPKEIEKGNAQLREYYESRARKAREEFENAKNNDVKYVEYNFRNVGVDGALLLDRAMKESEEYINKKTTALGQIGQIEAQKDALRRNYENVQMDLQRKIQASKENIQKLIEQQATTTSRIEVGLLRQQQDKEVKKQEGFQKDYDKEEARYKASKAELDEQIEKLSKVLVESLDKAEKGMAAEYQSFFEKVMKSAYTVAEKKVDAEKKEIIKERDKNEAELINVQTQIKRLLDENVTLRARLDEYTKDKQSESDGGASSDEGHFDEAGNFIYSDGSYHDTKGLFHDVDGKIYDMNGVLVSDEEEIKDEQAEKEEIVNNQINQFGAYISNENDEESVKPEIIVPESTDLEGIDEEAKEENETAEDVTDKPQEENQVEEGQAEEQQAVETETEQAVEEPKTEPQNGVDEATKVQETEVQESAVQEGEPEKNEEPAKEEGNDVQGDSSEEVTDKSEETEPLKEEEPASQNEDKEAVGIVDGGDKTPAGDEEEGKKEEAQGEENAKEDAENKPKKRGRPRKVNEEEVEEKAEPKKRGRPRKDSATATATEPEKTTAKKASPKKSASKKPTAKKTTEKKAEPKGTTAKKTATSKPAKTSTTKAPAKKTPAKKTASTANAKKTPAKAEGATASKRGRPRKSTATETPVQEETTAPKRRGRPRKNQEILQDIDSLAKINQLISEEEAKLNRMKALLNSELNQVIGDAGQSEVDKEKDELIEAVETLREQADSAKVDKSDEELSKINKRLEDLIKEITVLNNKK